MQSIIRTVEQESSVNNISYTALMSVYIKEKPEHLRESLNSLLAQTIRPQEILIVEDGLLSDELYDLINTFVKDYPDVFTIVSYSKNHGLWYALRLGVEKARNELIMRMDSDDISASNRAELQLQYMTDHTLCGCCGSIVEEFEGDVDNVISLVELPESHEEMVSFSKKRNPMRHPSMMYRKKTILQVGNYREMPFFEDYDLAMRLIDSGVLLYNIQKPLVSMRVNSGFYQRRGNKDYLNRMIDFRKECLRRGWINYTQYLITVIPHAIVCLLPNCLRQFIYVNLLRKKPRKLL